MGLTRPKGVGMVFAAWLAAGSPLLAAEAERGKPAPFFYLSTYNPEKCGTKRVFLDRLVGSKAKKPVKLLLLSFFDIDCKPCKQELPFLQALYERYRNAGLEILVVNCDHREEKIAQMLGYIHEAGFTFPVLRDRWRALQRRYGVESFPTLFFIDARAVIIDIRVGYDQKKRPFPSEELRRRLEMPPEATPDGEGKR